MKQNRFVKKLLFTAFFFSFFCYVASADEIMDEITLELPLITTQANKMIISDFSNIMFYMSAAYQENELDDDIMAVSMGTSLLGPLELSGQVSFSYIKYINDWIYVPFLVSGTAFDFISSEYPKGSLFAGSGIIITNRFFMLGLMSGLLLDSNTSKLFDFGVFPILNTSEYPYLSIIEKIYGFLYSNEENIADIKLDKLNYLLGITFKRFRVLSVLEVYIRNGYNDFRPEYDLSNIGVKIGQLGGLVGDSHVFTIDSNSKIYRTNVYGLRIGGERFIVDLNFLTIEDLETPIYDPWNKDLWGNEIIIGYKNYDYPISWLEGFPSVTFNFRNVFDTNGSIFVRFNSLNSAHTLALPFIPDIGMVGQFKDWALIATWMFPAGFSFSFRIISDRWSWW
ncbi:MAG: hypothetical protein LBH44_09640 [Treponema sp.]|nr:hypothetical protein [Treponema sp.]